MVTTLCNAGFGQIAYDGRCLTKNECIQTEMKVAKRKNGLTRQKKLEIIDFKLFKVEHTRLELVTS